MAKKPKRPRYTFDYNRPRDLDLIRAIELTAEKEGKTASELIREILAEALQPQIEALRHVPKRKKKPPESD